MMLNLEEREESIQWLTLEQLTKEAREGRKNSINVMYDEMVRTVEEERKCKLTQLSDKIEAVRITYKGQAIISTQQQFLSLENKKNRLK